jgi:hypothetical protein
MRDDRLSLSVPALVAARERAGYSVEELAALVSILAAFPRPQLEAAANRSDRPRELSRPRRSRAAPGRIREFPVRLVAHVLDTDLDDLSPDAYRPTPAPTPKPKRTPNARPTPATRTGRHLGPLRRKA